MARDVLLGVVVHRQRLVPELAAVEAGHDRARVHDVRHAALAQGLQVARRAQRACSGAQAAVSASPSAIQLGLMNTLNMQPSLSGSLAGAFLSLQDSTHHSQHMSWCLLQLCSTM